MATVTPGSNGRDRVASCPQDHRVMAPIVSWQQPGSEGIATVREPERYGLHVDEVRAVRSTTFVNKVGALLRWSQMTPAITMITTKPRTTRTVAPE